MLKIDNGFPPFLLLHPFHYYMNLLLQLIHMHHGWLVSNKAPALLIFRLFLLFQLFLAFQLLANLVKNGYQLVLGRAFEKFGYPTWLVGFFRYQLPPLKQRRLLTKKLFFLPLSCFWWKVWTPFFLLECIYSFWKLTEASGFRKSLSATIAFSIPTNHLCHFSGISSSGIHSNFLVGLKNSSQDVSSALKRKLQKHAVSWWCQSWPALSR